MVAWCSGPLPFESTWLTLAPFCRRNSQAAKEFCREKYTVIIHCNNYAIHTQIMNNGLVLFLSHTHTLTTMAACISGVLLSSATLTQLTLAPCARASAMRGKCCIAADRYSKAPGWRPLRSSSSSFSVHREWEREWGWVCMVKWMCEHHICVCV